MLRHRVVDKEGRGEKEWMENTASRGARVETATRGGTHGESIARSAWISTPMRRMRRRVRFMLVLDMSRALEMCFTASTFSPFLRHDCTLANSPASTGQDTQPIGEMLNLRYIHLFDVPTTDLRRAREANRIHRESSSPLIKRQAAFAGFL
jgi:hypothetical protein